MKHQYFGDVNDYRKYGLLRVLQRASGLRLGVCWMLTPDDTRADGKFIEYLGDPKRWRSHDPELFDWLATVVPDGRRLGHVVEKGVLPGAVFFDEIIPDDRDGRAHAISASSELLKECELVFFDPDNGIEIGSCRPGHKHSSKYLLWEEIAGQYESGKSVLVYQHFRREERRAFIDRMSDEIQKNAGCTSAVCFRTANVAFFLLINPGHRDGLLRATSQVAEAWLGQIEVIVDL